MFQVILVSCRGGRRSAAVCVRFVNMGFNGKRQKKIPFPYKIRMEVSQMPR
jgi:rhodanese-related sulfurtransferase